VLAISDLVTWFRRDFSRPLKNTDVTADEGRDGSKPQVEGGPYLGPYLSPYLSHYLGPYLILTPACRR